MTARIPTALLVSVLISLVVGGFEIVRRLDRIEARLDHNGAMSAAREREIDRRLATLEGAHGRPGAP